MMWRALAAFCVSGLASSAWAQPCLPTVIVQGTGATVRVEEALTPKQRTRGLMYRSELKRGTGMWFVFEQDKPRSFWMRNTQIPLDIVYINGYGFPEVTGGPMFWADQQGLDNILADIKRFGEEYGGPNWEPAPLLERLVAEGKTFASLQG